MAHTAWAECLFQLILFANKPVTKVSHDNQQYCTLKQIIHPTAIQKASLRKNYQDLFYYKQTLLLAFHLAYSINNILLISIIKKYHLSTHNSENSLSLLKIPDSATNSAIFKLHTEQTILALIFSTVVSWMYNEAQASTKIQSHRCYSKHSLI